MISPSGKNMMAQPKSFEEHSSSSKTYRVCSPAVHLRCASKHLVVAYGVSTPTSCCRVTTLYPRPPNRHWEKFSFLSPASRFRMSPSFSLPVTHQHTFASKRFATCWFPCRKDCRLWLWRLSDTSPAVTGNSQQTK